MKILLLNSTYESLSFIGEKKFIKLFYKEKIEIVSSWDDKFISFGKKIIKFPAIIRLLNYVRRNNTNIINFSKKTVFRRDNFTCQYCEKPLTSDDITLDHIIPRKLGGGNSYLNCVASCLICNRNKGHKTLDECNMKLIKQPAMPKEHFYYGTLKGIIWHPGWNIYLK